MEYVFTLHYGIFCSVTFCSEANEDKFEASSIYVIALIMSVILLRKLACLKWLLWLYITIIFYLFLSHVVKIPGVKNKKS